MTDRIQPLQSDSHYTCKQGTKMAGNEVWFPAIYHYALGGIQALVIQHEGLKI